MVDKKSGLSIKIDDKLASELARHAAKKQLASGIVCSISSVVRNILEDYVKNHPLK